MKNILKIAVVVVGLSVGAVAMAAGNLPVVKIIWGTNVPTSTPPAPISLNVWTPVSGCYVNGQPITQKGSYLRKDLNKIPACDRGPSNHATSMQAMVNYQGGGVACSINGHINVPFNGAKTITIKVTNFTYPVAGNRATASCVVQTS